MFLAFYLFFCYLATLIRALRFSPRLLFKPNRNLPLLRLLLFNFRSSSSLQQRYHKLLESGERVMGFQMQEDDGNDDQRKDG